MTVDTLGRALQLYRRTATSRSAILLVAANLIPLVGVLLFGWSLWTILVLYWVENGIVGFWNVPRIFLAQGSIVPTLPELPAAAARAATGGDVAAAEALQASWQRARVFGQPIAGGAGGVAGAGRVGLAIFFVMHYGIFWFVHGVFVFTLPMFLGASIAPDCLGVNPAGTPGALPGVEVLGVSCATSFGEVAWSSVLVGAVALFLSHGASFLFNYVGRGEYLTTPPLRQMGAPYGRVVILHVTILFGAFVVAFLGAPIGALLILVGLKTAFDLGLHLRERRAADARIPADTAYGRVIRGDPAADC